MLPQLIFASVVDIEQRVKLEEERERSGQKITYRDCCIAFRNRGFNAPSTIVLHSVT